MKKIVFLLGFLLVASCVSAHGWNLPADEGFVDCGNPDYFNSDVCTENDLEDEFQLVNDDLDDLDDRLDENTARDNKQSSKIVQNKWSIAATARHISENEDLWLIDGVGVSFGRVERYLLGEFMDLLRSAFAPKDSMYVMAAKLSILEDEYGVVFDENQVIERAARLKIEDTGEYPVRVSGWDCSGSGCTKEIVD